MEIDDLKHNRYKDAILIWTLLLMDFDNDPKITYFLDIYDIRP